MSSFIVTKGDLYEIIKKQSLEQLKSLKNLIKQTVRE